MDFALSKEKYDALQQQPAASTGNASEKSEIVLNSEEKMEGSKDSKKKKNEEDHSEESESSESDESSSGSDSGSESDESSDDEESESDGDDDSEEDEDNEGVSERGAPRKRKEKKSIISQFFWCFLPYSKNLTLMKKRRYSLEI